MTKSLSTQFNLFAHSPDGTVQPPLFATPQELLASKPVLGDTMPNGRNYVDDSKDHGSDGYETLTSLRERKTRQAKSRNLYTDIQNHGVQTPVSVIAMPPHALDEPQAGSYLHVADGHHRLFSALETRPTEPLLLEYLTTGSHVINAEKSGRPRRYPGQPE